MEKCINKERSKVPRWCHYDECVSSRLQLASKTSTYVVWCIHWRILHKSAILGGMTRSRNSVVSYCAYALLLLKVRRRIVYFRASTSWFTFPDAVVEEFALSGRFGVHHMSCLSHSSSSTFYERVCDDKTTASRAEYILYKFQAADSGFQFIKATSCFNS